VFLQFRNLKKLIKTEKQLVVIVHGLKSRKDFGSGLGLLFLVTATDLARPGELKSFFPESERTGPPVRTRPPGPRRERAAGAGGARDDMTEDDETLQTAAVISRKFQQSVLIGQPANDSPALPHAPGITSLM
jgi:hypothetical protein